MESSKHPVLGVMVNAVEPDEAVELVLQAARAKRSYSVSALATHGVMTGVLDPVQRWRLNRLALVVPDGQPVRWYLNRQHQCALRERVYGPDLMLNLCRAAAQEGLSIYLYGSTPEVVNTLQQRLQERFPQLRFAGTSPSRFRRLTQVEQEEIAQEITDSGADMVFVGLGCPRQETWVYELQSILSMPALAVGAAFDFHAGLKAQAPAILQRNGLEWLFRWFCEPKRLFSRTFQLYPRFVSYVLAEKFGFMRFPVEGSEPIEAERFG